MGRIFLGTASWTHRSLLESGWYPPDAKTPAARLGHYATRFPIVEVDSTYYAPPSEATVRGWADRTPDGFVFHVKAFSMLTGHPTRVTALYRDLRPATAGRTIYPGDLPDGTYDEIWRRFRSALDPLRAAGKLGVLLFQFPPWFRPGRASRDRIIDVARRCRPDRVAVELRNRAWFDGAQATAGTLDLLREHDLTHVVVDMPQGHDSSVPVVPVVTAEPAYVRFHGHSTAWTGGGIDARFAYDYGAAELAEWVPRLRALAEAAGSVHVLFNNCCADTSPRNAAELAALLNVQRQTLR